MFQYRTSNFAPSVAAIQKHLGAVETELEKIGRIAGRQTSMPRPPRAIKSAMPFLRS